MKAYVITTVLLYMLWSGSALATAKGGHHHLVALVYIALAIWGTFLLAAP